MSILTRYLIRAHVGPMLFALSVLTSLLFLNAVAQRMEDLVGKGLGWQVIGEFMLLSLPHTVALTLPMSVLVAVLYAFSEITAANEFTALAAGGVRPARILIPLLGVGAILGGVVLFFNDRVLPEGESQTQESPGRHQRQEPDAPASGTGHQRDPDHRRQYPLLPASPGYRSDLQRARGRRHLRRE